jgi:hypothetical protein
MQCLNRNLQYFFLLNLNQKLVKLSDHLAGIFLFTDAIFLVVKISGSNVTKKL